MMLPRIAAHVFNTPLMVHQGKAAAIVAGLGSRMLGGAIDYSGPAAITHVAFENGRPSMGTLAEGVERRAQQRMQPIYDQLSGAAIIPVEGTLVHKGAWVGSYSGDTSYEGLQAQITRARRDASVKGVVFEIDSYGGQVSGAFETAEMLFSLSREKPTIAILTDNAHSAGYLLASACRSIVLPETGGCGSIGVITMHADYSKALDMQGVKVTMIAEGAHKADFNPYEALPQGVADAVRAQIAKTREKFCATVAKHRGARLSFEAAMATESDCYVGEDAVKRGLADATGNPNEVFSAFISALNRA